MSDAPTIRQGKMNHSQNAAADLINFANEMHKIQVKPACDAWVPALARLRAISLENHHPLDQAFAALADLYFAATELENMGKHVQLALRSKLAASMAEHGSPGFYTSGHHVTPTEAARTVTITNQKALAADHPEMMVTPPAAPDKKAIAYALKNNRVIQGACLSNGGTPGVRFTSLKGTS